MNNIKSVFSIKDLENLSGIKAHTIRIWEKRYQILEPMRNESNIRTYDTQNLQKLLNIVLLHKYGYKISKIAQYPEEKIPMLVREIVSEKNAKNHALNDFKMAMMSYNQNLFINTYNRLLAETSFRNVFYEVFLPLMEEIGLLWQSETITPSQEHFISNLIRQKIISNIDKIQTTYPTKTDEVFVLYLPLNEIHELGLLYLNYELILNGYQTVYLGENVPLENLIDLKNHFKKITFISYLTIEPERSKINEYITQLTEHLVTNQNHNIWLIGRMIAAIDQKHLNPNIKAFTSIEEIISIL